MGFELVGRAEGKIVRIPLAEGVNRINRSRLKELDLRAPSVSREHAQIEINGAEATIRDLGSSNGTLVDGQLVLEPQPLTPGAAIRFGDVELVFQDSNAPIADAARRESMLARPDEVSATAVLSFDEVRAALDKPAAGDQALIQTLSEAGEILVRPRSLEETLDALMDLVERVITARRILLLLNEEGEEEPQLRAARPATHTEDRLILSRTLVNTVLQDRKALLLADTMADDRFKDQQSIVQLNLRSAMVAPLFDNTQVIGLLYSDSDDPRTLFDRDKLRVFSLLANLIAVKITNTRLQEVEREKERMTQQLEVAAMLQKRLLPDALPEVSGYELLARQLPCFEVAGDLYDVSLLDDGRLVLALGDVTGKGIGASLLMANVMASLRVLYQEPPDLGVWIDRIHRQILQSSDELHSVTLFLGLLDPHTHRLEYVSAGHDPVLVIPAAGEALQLAATGLPAGMIRGMTYEVASVDLAPGTLVAIYSDGIREAMQDEEDVETMFGLERMEAGLRSRAAGSLAEMADGLLGELNDHVGRTTHDDDVSLLLVRRR